MRLNIDEKTAVADAAERAGMAVSAYVSEAALAATRETAPPGPDRLGECAIELHQAWTQLNRVGADLNQSTRVLRQAGQANDELVESARQVADTARRIEVLVQQIRDVGVRAA